MSPKAGCDQLLDTLAGGFICRQVFENRYLDVGDWGDDYVHAVSHLDPRSTAAVLVHEIVEKLLCDHFGITPQEVDRDDAMILKGKKKLYECRYYRHHRTATRIERELCKAMKLDWKRHEKNVDEAWKRQEELLAQTA